MRKKRGGERAGGAEGEIKKSVREIESADPII
jgi:hypothetical protein